MKKKQLIVLLVSAVMSGGQVMAQTPRLTLDSLRSLAIAGNKSLRMGDMRLSAAKDERRAALTKYLPRVNATGAYLHSDKEISLLSDGHKAALPALDAKLGGMGSKLVEDLRTDTRNMGMVAVMLTQPVYMGGRIAAYNRITRYAEQIAMMQNDRTLQDVIVEVDETFWQIAALKARRELAGGFLRLVERLDSDVQQMIDAGIATKADGLSVKVKVNEARVAVIQVDNALDMSKMKLCQICGLDITTDIDIDDGAAGVEPSVPVRSVDSDVQTAFASRAELKALDLSVGIHNEKVRLARAEFMPTVALMGGWTASNPSVFNSFERKMKGMWNVGVAVSIPLVTCGERIYKVRAARTNATIARLELEETREKVELQINQSHRRLNEAGQRLETALRGKAEADENMRYATLGMKEGVIPVSSVLDAQTAWLSAHSQCVDAEIDLRLARLYLDRATGTVER